jgi:hypothetical protein
MALWRPCTEVEGRFSRSLDLEVGKMGRASIYELYRRKRRSAVGAAGDVEPVVLVALGAGLSK